MYNHDQLDAFHTLSERNVTNVIFTQYMPAIATMDAKCLHSWVQIDIVNAEAYHYDGDCIAKAEDMGFQGLVDIKQRHVRTPIKFHMSASLTSCVDVPAIHCVVL